MTSHVKEKGRLLAINFGGIGDEILFQPTLRTIREALPEWSITLLLEPRSSSFSELTDLIDNTITFDIKKKPLLTSDLMDLLFTIRNGGYDLVLSSGSSTMVSALLYLSGVPVRVGYGSNTLSTFLLNKACPLDQTVYAGEMYHSLATGLCQLVESGDGGKNKNGDGSKWCGQESNFIPEIKCDLEAEQRMNTALAERGIDDRQKEKNARKYHMVLIHPGTSKLAHQKGIIKTWSADNWSRLAQSILDRKNTNDGKEIKVVLCGGPDDSEIIEEIESKMKELPVLSAYGCTRSLKDLAALIHLSDLFICVDSAPMHVAVGLNKDLVALFGPTNPALLLPRSDKFSYVWDNPDPDQAPPARSMFDGKGVNLDPHTVFDTVKKKLS